MKNRKESEKLRDVKTPPRRRQQGRVCLRVDGVEVVGGVEDIQYRRPQGKLLILGGPTPHAKPMLRAASWQALGPVFFVTSVRRPLERCLSNFYYNHMYEDAHAAHAEAKLTWLNTSCTVEKFANDVNFEGEPCCEDYVYRFLSFYWDEPVDEVLAHYAFIFVVERMEDSLLAFAQKFEVPLSDLIHIQLRESGTRHTCHFLGSDGKKSHAHPKLEEEEPDVIAYAKTDFPSRNRRDAQIWEEASARIDALLRRVDPSTLATRRLMLRKRLDVAEKYSQLLS